MNVLFNIFSNGGVRILFAALLTAGFICFSASVGQPPAESESGLDDIPLAVRIFFRPLPDKMPGGENDTPEMVSLGRLLFFERGISVNKSQACSDCHPIDDGRAGVDNKKTSLGATGVSGTRNSPTVYNAGFQMKQFWDARAADLVEQAKGPLLNPIEMGMKTEEEVVSRLESSDVFSEGFRLAFPQQRQPITFDNIARAIAAFERTLIAPARFDRYLVGQADAITDAEKIGLNRFVDTGCIECHSGATVGGRLLKKLGERHPYQNKSDQGRFKITALEEDMFVFKACMLRNVTLTSPYFHDGEVSTLDEAVRLMAWLQLNIKLSDAEIDEIKSFLHALEGENLTAKTDTPPAR